METEGGIVVSPDDSLGDPYDLAMAQMRAHMLVDGDDNQSLDAASGHSDEELRNIMGPESREGFANSPVSVTEPTAKVARSENSRQQSGTSRRSRPGTIVGSTGGRGSQNAGVPGKENIKTRARPRKMHEAEPFLSIDTLPIHNEHNMPAPTRERTAGSQKGNQLMRKKLRGSGKSQARAPPGTPAHPVFGACRSRMGRSSSAVSSEWNALVPRQKYPQSAALENPINKRVKDPFKHNVNKPDYDKAPRPMSPGQTMKEKTVMATVHLARTIAKHKGEEEQRIGGRLLKGRLKPLYPVKVEGPTMQHCRGVVSEENPFMNNESRTVARRRQIMAGMLTKDFLFERPQTAQSVHHTSVASDLSDGREREVDQELEEQKEGTRMPPNSLASTVDVNHRNGNINLGRGGASASGLSSDVFEIDEIPRASAVANQPLPLQQSTGDSPKPLESSSRQGSAGRRPNTGKAVRFADAKESVKDASGGDANKGDEESKDGVKIDEGCRPKDVETNKKREEDPDSDGPGGNGGGNGNGGNPEQNPSSTIQDQNASQDQNNGEKNGKNGNENNEADCSDGEEHDVVGDGEAKDNTVAVSASYNTVLYTSEEIRFPRAGSMPRPKSKKGTKPKQFPRKPRQAPAKDMTDMALVVAGRDTPTKDYYDQFARSADSRTEKRSRPQSAGGRGKTPDPIKLRRPISASVPSRGQEPKVQFVVKPNTRDIDLDNGDVLDQALRLNEVPCPSRPLSARTQTSGVPSSARSTLAYHDQGAGNNKMSKQQVLKADFKLEGTKMSQGIKTGVCTECGKPTNNIADYWEETGCLVCDVCDRTTRAAENQKIEWIRQKLSQVYREDPPGGEQALAITEHGEKGNITMEDLERSLLAVKSEIDQCVKDALIDVPLVTSEDEEEPASDEDDDELLALTYGDTDNRERALVKEKRGYPLKDADDSVQLAEGEISKILTEVEADPAALSQYEMRVYWYQEYCKSKLKSESLGKVKAEGKPRLDSSDEVYDGLKRAIGRKTDNGEINVYNVKLMCDEAKDATQALLEENDQASKHIKHFKGERLSSIMNDGTDAATDVRLDDLGVSGTAAKLTKTRSRSGRKLIPEAVAPFAPLCFRINARPPQGFLYYFAYGPDMNPDRMGSYIQRSVAADRLWGLLYGFSLVFNKKGLDAEAGAFPNIELRPGSSTEGCLYLITLDELDKLDRHLGYPEHYDHAMLPVWLLNCGEPDEYGVAQYCVPALVFVTKDEWIHKGEEPLPNEYIVDQCMKGGSNILSPAYHQHLQSLKTVQVAC